MSFALKVRLLTLFFSLFFILIVARLFFWQIVQGGRLSAAADRQHFYSLALPATRGEIRTVDGTPLVANREAYLLYAYLPKIPADKENTARKLADILSLDVPDTATAGAAVNPQQRQQFLKETTDRLRQNVLARLNYQNALWVNLAHFLTRSTRTAIDDLKISGLGFEVEDTRDYPEASMSAHILGFVGSDENGNPKGYFGLEGYYDRELSGVAGQVRLEKDALGRPIAIGSETREEKRDGSNLTTTIDKAIQLFVETHLLSGIKTWQASGGTAIVMDPAGAILAMASFPRYDPADFSYYPDSLYKNPAVAELFEPGSIIKPLVMAGAINENKVTPETRCGHCDGPRQIGEYVVHTFNDQYHPGSSMTEVLVNSDNTGMVEVGEKVGFTKLYSYLKKFGLGEKTGVDLEEEQGQDLRSVKDYYPIDQATLTFGQGILVNALQMVRAFSVLANGGRLITPFIVREINNNNRKIVLSHPPGPQVISAVTAKTVTEMLVRVANESPTHFPKDRLPELANYRLAAKSGTAQIAVGGKYKETGTIASVIGYFPADHPRFVVYVKLNEPEVRPWGSDTAGPVFFAIVKSLIDYYGIPPK